MTNERRLRLKEYIDSRGEATTAELSALCGECSAMTLWRDLQKLEADGAIRRTRGGAISMRLIQPDVEGLYSQRAMENTEAKRRIAEAAVKLIHTGSSVFFDAGSTVMGLAKRLPDAHFTIITSGANIAIELSQRRYCNVMCVGGQISANTLSFSGPQAESFLEGVNIDTAIMAPSGYSDASGFTSGSFTEHQLKKRVMEKAAHVVMLMDVSKLNRSLPFTFATLKEVDTLIVDEPLPEESRRAAKAAGAEIIVAP